MLAKKKSKRKKAVSKNSVSKKRVASRVKSVKRKNKNVVVELFVAVFVLIIILIALIAYSFGAFEEKTGPQFFEVKDECSLMMGNLIHQIRDDGECRNKCVNECDVRSMEFVSFEFEAKNDDCSYCGCYCE